MFNPLANPLDAKKKSPNAVVKFEVARSKEALTEAFQLIYHSYFRAGLIVDNPSGMRLTPYHLLPSTEVLVARVRDTTVSTISLIGDGELGLPMESMYAKEVASLRDQGLRLAEVGSLADRRESPRRFIETLAGMARLLGQVAQSQGIEALVAAVHPKHARLYQRVLGFQQVGDFTECPYVNDNPAVALYLRFEEMPEKLYNQFFGEPFAAKQLTPYHWESETKRYFQHVLAADGKIANVIGLQGFYNWQVNSTTK